MAAVMRFRIQDIARKLLHTSLSNRRYVQNKVISCFHSSSFLNAIGQEIKMPSLSPTMSEGTIVKWLKKEGDPIAPGDVLCDIQTDKAVVSLEVEEEGILAKILVAENTPDVKVGTLIALMVNEGEDWKAVELPPGVSSGAPPSSESKIPEAVAASSGVAASSAGAISSPASDASFHTATLKSYGPAVRYLLLKYDLKADAVTPTGHRNKLLKMDVLKYIESNKIPEKKSGQVAPPSAAARAVPSPPGKAKKSEKPVAKKAGADFIDIELSNMRKTIARRLTESKTIIPHSYGSISCNISKLLEFRKKLKSEGVGVSINDFVVKAVAQALVAVPEVNAHFVNDKVVLSQDVDISIAVATDKGLITPILKDAVKKGLVEISAIIRDLAIRAREGKLQLHEFQGGSFSISNLGMFGIKEFSAIINPPQCGILAIGGGQQYIDEEGKSQTKMYVTLSYDRRAFDEAKAAEFLSAFQNMIEDPSMMMIGGLENVKSAMCET